MLAQSICRLYIGSRMGILIVSVLCFFFFFSDSLFICMSNSISIFCIQWLTTALEALASHLPTAQDLDKKAEKHRLQPVQWSCCQQSIKNGEWGDLFHNTDPLILRMSQSPVWCGI